MPSTKNTYSDGSESDLLSFFTKPESKLQKEIDHILASNPSWPIQYHLSPVRKNLLDWYDFKPNAKILEIGAGCGAVTGVFLEKGLQVTALELEKNRASIIKKRYADYKNLKVLSKNIFDYKPKVKFDYVTLIGVLEYSGRFYNKKEKNHLEPYIIMLKTAKSFLKPGGTLIIAIENRLGLKYLSGSAEDHYGSLLEGIYNYPNYNKVMTFSEKELKKVLSNSGLSKNIFYYPFPDYKIPNQILSKRYLGKLKNTNSIYPTYDPANKKEDSLDEVLFSSTLIQAGVNISTFANSFLIFSKNL